MSSSVVSVKVVFKTVYPRSGYNIFWRLIPSIDHSNAIEIHSLSNALFKARLIYFHRVPTRS